jgi:hypothetical protein
LPGGYDVTGNEGGYSSEVSYDLAKLDPDKHGPSDRHEFYTDHTNPDETDTDDGDLSEGVR